MASAHPAQRERLSLLTLPTELKLQIVELTAERPRGTVHFQYVVYCKGPLDVLRVVVNLFLTCKAMANLCIYTLYKRVAICSPSAACNFLLALKRRSHICEHVRTLIMVTAESGEPCNIAEAKKVISAEPKAKSLLKAGSVKVQSLVAMSILHRLPRLRMLGVSDSILRLAQRWPETKIVGSSLLALVIRTQATRGSAQSGLGPYEWMDSFKPGQLPGSLRDLSMHYVCDKRCRTGAPHHHWAAVAASLTFLSLTDAEISSSVLTQLLQHCRHLKDLIVGDLTLSIEAIVEGILASRSLESSLLSACIISETMVQAIVTDCNKTLSSFFNSRNLGA